MKNTNLITDFVIILEEKIYMLNNLTDTVRYSLKYL